MNRETLLIAVISLMSAVAGIWFFQRTQNQVEFVSASNNIPLQNKTIRTEISEYSFEQIVLKNLNNELQHLSEWKQPVLILNFWAPWCAPCRREIPALIEIQNKYSDQLQIIGLSFDHQDKVRSFAEEFLITYPLLIVKNEASKLNQFFGNHSGGLPFTVILNKNRQIIFQYSGEISDKSLEKQIMAIL